MLLTFCPQGWGVDCDEVVAGLFIGDKAAASSVPFLRRQVAQCRMNYFYCMFVTGYHSCTEHCRRTRRRYKIIPKAYIKSTNFPMDILRNNSNCQLLSTPDLKGSPKLTTLWTSDFIQLEHSSQTVNCRTAEGRLAESALSDLCFLIQRAQKWHPASTNLANLD